MIIKAFDISSTSIGVVTLDTAGAGQVLSHQTILLPGKDLGRRILAAGQQMAQMFPYQRPDPATAPLLVHVPHLPKLDPQHIKPCSSCGARIYWSDTRGERPAPFDVTDEGYATRINHFTTCKTADQHRKAGAKKGRAA